MGARAPPHRKNTAASWSWVTSISASSPARRSRWPTVDASRSSRSRVGDEVLSCYGSGDFRPAPVLRVHESRGIGGIEITLASGRKLVSTPEHMHFAGYVVGRTPQLHMTYLMWKRRHGFQRRHVAYVYERSSEGDVRSGDAVQREGGDAVWVVGTHTSEAEARLARSGARARYGTSDAAVQARGRVPPARTGAWSGTRRCIDRLFADTRHREGRHAPARRRGPQLRLSAPRRAADNGLSFGSPRRRLRWCCAVIGAGGARSTGSRSFGYDDEGRRALESLGLSVRPARQGSSRLAIRNR